MKKFSGILIRPLLAICVAALFCCHGYHHGVCAEKSGTTPYRVLATTFPVYLFAKGICATAPNVRVELLVPAVAGCPHDYAPSPADLQKLAKADVLLINGWGLEDFLQKAIQKAAPGIKIIDAGRGVPVLEEKDGDINPHIFGAPKQAALMMKNIARELAAANPQNAAIYKANARTGAERLENLSAEFQKMGKSAKNRKIVLEHDALSYMAANAGLEIVAMVPPHPAASALIQLTKDLKKSSPALLAGDSQYSDRALKTLARETGLPFAMLNPCAAGPEDAGFDYYLQRMEENRKILGGYFE